MQPMLRLEQRKRPKGKCVEVGRGHKYVFGFALSVIEKQTEDKHICAKLHQQHTVQREDDDDYERVFTHSMCVRRRSRSCCTLPSSASPS